MVLHNFLGLNEPTTLWSFIQPQEGLPHGGPIQTQLRFKSLSSWPAVGTDYNLVTVPGLGHFYWKNSEI